MPRYESDHLKENFSSYAMILEEKLKPEEFYPFIDLLIGGGGTMNLEVSYYGIPVISTRSLFLYHDTFLLDNQLMTHVKTKEEALNAISSNLKKGINKENKKFFCKEKCCFENIIKKIEAFLKEN